MKSKLLLLAALASALLATGCATRTTASGGRETTLLGGAVTVATNSFEPTNPATVDADTSKIISAGNPTGKKTTLFWGLITLHDY
jgi:ABC-type glycerol-3-phosphate transport system substrate-binding protein